MPTPLVLVPALLCDERLFAAQVAALQSERQVVVVEPWPYADLDALASAVLAAVDGPFALAGVSMGGYAAFAVLRRAPERVERVALICTRAEGDTDEGRAARADLVAEARTGGFADVAARLGMAWLAPIHRDRSDLVATLAAMARRVGVDGFANEQAAIAGRPDARELLPTIRVPTLVVAGRDDTLTPPAALQAIADAVPDADLAVLGGCGHMAPLERPDTVTALLCAWLAR